MEVNIRLKLNKNQVARLEELKKITNDKTYTKIIRKLIDYGKL